jgi:radical SAM protein with 4Fe4S-binding SPASM domain
MACSIRIPGIEFDSALIDDAVAHKRLLSIEIELSLRCNFRCPYCYVPDKSALQNELTLDEIKDVIMQAHALGARKIILLGGEPMLYPYLFEVIEHIRAKDMAVEMFTNGFGITEGIAKKLFSYSVDVVLKMNTFDEALQDELAGHKGAYTIIQDAFRSLCAAGYPSDEPFLAVSTIIGKKNMPELRKLWAWLRDQKILPYFEIITPQGEANVHNDLMPDMAEIKSLFFDLQKLDREHYGIEWTPQPPLAGNKCLRHRFSCLVTSKGDVHPCVGVPIAVGNIRTQALATIIADSEVIQNLRDFKDTIKGPCRSCDKAEHCYGCRGAAFNLTGDYLASDPLCWLNTDRADAIDRLPMAMEGVIPQSAPMRVIDELLTMGERKGTAAVTVKPDMLFIDKNGLLDEVVYTEMIAQTMAALSFFEKKDSGRARGEGFLIGAKKVVTHTRAHAGDRLIIAVTKETKFGDFGIVHGTVTCNGALVAEGEIKVYERIAGGKENV